MDSAPDARALWNAWVPHHLRSAFYDVEGFVAGRCPLSPLERELLGRVDGLDLLHLQCHFGQDTLALARLGARVTGLDLAEAGLEAAAALAGRCGLDARWVHGDVLERHPALEGGFDVVFVNLGALCWLPRLDAWATHVAAYLRPGGRLVLCQLHPLVMAFDDRLERLEYSYFGGQPVTQRVVGSYAAPDSGVEAVERSWNHGVGDIVGALLAAGLRLERLEERDGCPHPLFPGMVQGPDGQHRVEAWGGRLPLMLGAVARRPGGGPQ